MITIQKHISRNIPLIIMIGVLGLWLFQKIQFYQSTKLLKSMDPQQVQLVRIYPGVSGPFGTAIEFKGQDPIIEDFIHSVSDIRRYWGGRYTVNTHGLFVEIFVKDGVVIQMNCSIPDGKKPRV